MKKYFISHLQSLRGIAAIIILLHHQKSISRNLAQNDFMANSDLAVDFFFVLSGFVIALNYQNIVFTLKTAISFIKKRFLRLYPLHFIMLLIYLMLELLKYYFEKETGLISNEPSFSKSNFSSFISNLFLLQGLVDSELSYNEVSWSISFEFYTYILFAFIIFFIRNKIIYFSLIVLITILSLIFVYKLGLMDESNRLGYLRCSYSFFLGTLAYNINNKIKDINLSILEIPIFLITIYLFCYIPNTTFMPFMFALLILTLNQTNKGYIKRLLNNKFLIYIGKISYSIYMIHYLVIWINIQSLRFIFKVDTEIRNNYTYLKLSNIDSTLFIIFTVIIVIILSSISYNLIEKKFLQK